MRSQRRRKIVRLYTDDHLKNYLPAIWTDGKREIDVPITLAKHFVRRASRGIPWTCLLAEAVRELAHQQPALFPHKVKLVYVIGSAVYILTHVPRRVGGTFRCVRYAHNFTRHLRRFDTFSNRRFLREFADADIVATLKVPKKHGAPGYRGNGGGNSDGKVRILKGAHRRAVDAGIIPPVPMAA